MADLATLKIAVDSRPVDQASNDLDELATSANRAEKATAGLTNQTKATGAAMAGMNNAVRQAKAAQEAAAQAMGGVAGRTKLASHEITNLAFQFQDLGVQIAGGANPLVALAQQGSQVSGIMMQSGMSVGVFTKAVLSMIASTTAAVVMNPVFLGIAAAVGTVSAAVNFMADDITKASGVTVTAGDVMLGAFDVIKKAIKTQVSAAFEAMGIDTAKVWSNVVEYTRKAVNIIIGAATLAPRTIITAFRVLPSGIADAFYSAVNFGIRAINGLLERSVSAINSFLDAVNPILEKAGLSIGRLTTPRIAELQNNYAGAAAKAANAFVQVARETIERDYVGDIGKGLRDAAVSQALQRQAEEGGKKVGKKMGKSAAKEFKDTLGKELADMELAVMNGLTDTMRELQETISALTTGDVNQMMSEINKRSDERVKLANAETEARVKTNEELVKTVDYLDQVFGLDGNLGKLFGALKSGFSDVFDAIGGAFGGLRDSVSNLLANLGTSFKQVAAGAAIGGIAAQATGGSALGGTIGGGIGQALGSKFLSSALGSFAGPLGSIAGGLLGGLIGGLFSGTKQASATLSSIGGRAVVSGITGNNSQLKGVANNMATGLLKGIGSIAEQLGGQLGGAVSLSIGQRKKDFVVDPTGKGRTKGAGVINFGEDQAAAIAYATQLAIQQGIITGLSAGANTLIKAGGDLQAQLEKALKFDQVFRDLREQTDPLGFALDNLSREMEKLKTVFAEAGATAADYAALEELYSIKRQKVLFESERPRRELEIQLMEATGDAAGALAAKRMLELDAMDASLRGLQQQIYAAEDAAAAREVEAAAQEAALQQQLAAAQAQREAEAELARQREEAAQRVKEAEDALRQAYQREASAFQDTIDRFRDLGKTLREFAATLLPLNGSGSASLDELNRKFRETAALARLGSTEAMAALPGIGGDLRDAIIDTATDRVSMLRRLSEVRKETEAVADVADRQVSVAQQQLDALTTQVEQFVTLNDSVLSVRDAITQLKAAQIEANRIGATSAAAATASISVAATAAKTQGFSQAQQLYINTMMDLNSKMGHAGYGSEAEIKEYVSQLSDYQSLASLANIQGIYRQFDDPESGYKTAANLSAYYGVPVGTYANGGLHSGGLRVVGENGPELEATGPSRIYNANQLGNMMGSGATADEVRALRDELKVVMFQIAKNTGKTSDQLQRWDGDGLPDARGF